MYRIYINDNWKKGTLANSFEEMIQQIGWCEDQLQFSNGGEIHVLNELTNEDVTNKAITAKFAYNVLMDQVNDLIETWEK